MQPLSFFRRLSQFSIFLIITSSILIAGCGGGGITFYNSELPVKIQLTATATGPGSAYLSWTAADSAPTYYSVYMNGAELGLLYPADGTSVSVTTLTPNTRYCFIVYAVAAFFGRYAQSNQACITTPASIHPNAPANLTVTAISPGQIVLAWSPSTGDFSGYRIYRDNTLIATTSAVSYSDNTARSSTQYCYSLSAYDQWGYESPRGAAVCATTPIDNTAPSVPSNVKVLYDPASAANPTILLSWNASTDNSGTVTGYKIYRDAVFAAQVTTPNYSDAGRSANTQYCYTITALDSTNNESSPSNPACATTSWKLATVDSNVDVQWTAIAVDANDKLHIAYYDGLNTGPYQQVGSVNYATNLSGTWQTVVIDSVAPTVYGSLAMLVNTDGSLHAAYYDFNNRRVRHAVSASGAWLTQSIVQNASNVTTVSMVHDVANHLHLVYNPNGNVTYMTDASGTWTSLLVGRNGVSYGDATTCAIAVDASGAAHIAYYEYSTPALKYASNASGSWVIETVDSSADVGLHTAIAVDAGGKAHISYYDVTNGDLKYATNTSGTWIAQTVDSVGDVGLSTSIAVDASGHAHISYTDATNHSLKYANNASGTWMTYAIDSTSYVAGLLSSGAYTSITVDSTGKIHISYRGDTHLRYASNR